MIRHLPAIPDLSLNLAGNPATSDMAALISDRPDGMQPAMITVALELVKKALAFTRCFTWSVWPPGGLPGGTTPP